VQWHSTHHKGVIGARRKRRDFSPGAAARPLDWTRVREMVRSHTFYFKGTELYVGPDPYQKGSITGNYSKPRPTPPQGVTVQLPRPSVDQYILGPLLIHEARWRWH